MLSIRDIATSYVQGQGYTVEVQTNVTPAITVYDSSNTEPPGLLANLFQVGVTLRDRDGNKIANYGGDPQINIALAGALGFVLISGALIVLSKLKR